MDLVIPVLVKQPPRNATGESALVQVRPLFHPGPCERDLALRVALGRLRRALREVLQNLGRAGRDDAVADFAWHPQPSDMTVEIPDLPGEKGNPFRVYAAVFSALGRRLAYLPDLGGLTVAIERSQSAEAVIADAVRRWATRYVQERRPGRPAGHTLIGRAWVVTVTVDYVARAPRPAEPPSPRRMLGRLDPAEGADELATVGRDLAEGAPDALPHAWFRETELATLHALMDRRYVRPVLLLGEPGAGKTALIRGYVRQRAEAQQRLRRKGTRPSCWLLSPQRLISGMSFVGEWEQRLHAILAEARRARHVLVFDDLVGLFQAGLSSGSNLSIGHVLHEVLRRERIRVLAEATPATFRVLRETDRGFADLFRVLPVPPLDEATTARILVRCARTLEHRYHRFVEPTAYPPVMHLQQRYHPREVFPGKAVRFLERVCSAPGPVMVDGVAVLDEFARTSGLDRRFLDDASALEASEIRNRLTEQVVGQESAIAAMVAAVSRAKARLNEPGRPLATLLFLGPTGTGKTECAKALAAMLFGCADRLLRFDMNEYVAAGSVARLAGGAASPEGMLTGAIRQQPFAVLLFDEIEKAAPEVHDLLLQVLGEGRLTNARGETADFSNAVVILTSNLGTAESGRRVGLREEESDRGAGYVAAAERFFRPEFFNRLDRVVPFRSLTRTEMRRIAALRLRELTTREGFVRRGVILDVDPRAMEQVVDAGYHPHLGARALKRALEDAVVAPVAERLAAADGSQPAIVRLLAGPQHVLCDVRMLAMATPFSAPPASPEPTALLAELAARVEAIERDLLPHKPAGSIAVAGMQDADRWYFGIRQILEEVRARLRRAGGRAAPRGRGVVSPTAEDRGLPGLSGLLTLVEAGVIELRAGRWSEVVLLAQGVGEQSAAAVQALLAPYLATAESLGGEGVIRRVSDDPGAAFRVTLHGPGLRCLFEPEAGTHVFHAADGRLTAVQIAVFTHDAGTTDPAQALLSARDRWCADVQAGRKTPAEDPFPRGPIVGVYRFDATGPGSAVAVRTGARRDGWNTPTVMRELLLAALVGSAPATG